MMQTKRRIKQKMGFYSQVLFPCLLDWSMAGSPMNEYRKELLQNVRGNVLEIGFGIVLNNVISNSLQKTVRYSDKLMV